MRIGTAHDEINPISCFANGRRPSRPMERLRWIRAAAREFREVMLEGAPVRYFKACDLVRVPYPTRYGLRDACTVPIPLLHILNRMFVVQFEGDDRVITLLVSPSDTEGNTETPFFKRLGQSFGVLQRLAELVLAPRQRTVEQWLGLLGISPEQVDYITFDHLHTQDLRNWLGHGNRTPFFPNAKLLVMRQEWESALDLLPPQKDWYCPDGVKGIAPEGVILLDGDVMLGKSVALVNTPGHTEGNHSIVVNTKAGLFVTSENGISADSYVPVASRIPSLARYARQTGMEVVLNGNTLERGLDQYMSMVQEKEIAGVSRQNPSFFNILPSSELSLYWLFPGLGPTFTFGNLEISSPVAEK